MISFKCLHRYFHNIDDLEDEKNNEKLQISEAGNISIL